MTADKIGLRAQWRILDVIPVGACILDADFSVRFWNRRLEEWTGFQAGDIEGTFLSERFPLFDTPFVRTRISQAASGGPPALFSSSLHRNLIPCTMPDGERRVLRTMVLPLDHASDDISSVIMVIEDLTDLTREVRAYRAMRDTALEEVAERKAAEAAIKDANDEANLYLDIMAHDIKNANLAAVGYLSMFECIKNEEGADLVMKATSAVNQSTEIVTSVETIRRVKSETESLHMVRLNEIALHECNRHGRMVECSISPFMVWADSLLSEVFTNLIGNSIKYGGEDVEVLVTAEEKDDFILVSVEDTGPGIPDEEKPFVFERFRRGARPRAGGSGLGLFIVHMLVRQYGGEIWVEDRVEKSPDDGLRVCFTLKKIRD